MKARTTVILFGLFVILLLFVYLFEGPLSEQARKKAQGQPLLFPDFARGAAAKIEVKSTGKEIALEKQEDAWRISATDGFTADTQAVNNALDTIADFKRESIASKNPEKQSDTVGFIRGLPHSLIAAFKSTLDETAEADLLLHVVDAASPARAAQMAEVDRVLEEIGAADVPRIVVYNKIDLTGRAASVERDPCDNIVAVSVSAQQGLGLDLLAARSRSSRGGLRRARLARWAITPWTPTYPPLRRRRPDPVRCCVLSI